MHLARGALAQLGLLEVPVFDVEDVLLAERAQPPVRSASATVAAVLSAMSATILASFKVSPKLTMPLPGQMAKRGAGSSMVWPWRGRLK
jgi:hypothetical protein